MIIINGKKGINYKTNRKISIGGKIHEELKKKFIIQYGYNYVLFKDLIGIESYKYLQETKQINYDINIENIAIKNYNNLVHEMIEKINGLQKWNDFIEFEGIKYGLPNIYNNIHYENDCKGNISITKLCIWECRHCRGSTSFYEPCRCEYKEDIEC